MGVDLLENCSECYQSTLSQFPDEIIIVGNLEADTSYYFKVTDKFNNSYITEEIATNSNGTAIIQIQTVGYTPQSFTEDPGESWLNKDAGNFLIEASMTINPWIPVEFSFGSGYDTTNYPCITVNFVNDNSGLNIIE